ncbi:hypothetical protein GCM10011583_25500 [Streptomyces camponoticapitis]|uniref:Uncharacterized protein n=1 Tax=Streptomyces camponoticapitis TaxID=1616125 RepID=A0ABQ2E7Q6_9ACTN|nr:hypothetical protein GCM10011583_25500 [Streptomyces camponoticapitis]
MRAVRVLLTKDPGQPGGASVTLTRDGIGRTASRVWPSAPPEAARTNASPRTTRTHTD